MAKYDISRQALEDLYKIWEYTVDTWSETQADKYYKLLENAMDEIGTNPQPQYVCTCVIGRKMESGLRTSV